MARRSGNAPPQIGTRIRERRLSLGRRQSDIARGAQISAAYLNLIEHNRRPVSDALLGRLAQALDTDVKELASDREELVIAALREAAARIDLRGPQPAEIDRITEFAARFPGWAAVLAGTLRLAEGMERRLVSYSDRMSRDPYLLTTLHEVQSAVTALRSTASILAETPDIDDQWRNRFHAILDQDSQRLSRTAQALVAYLDSFEDDIVPMSPREEVEAWIAAGEPNPLEAPELASDVARAIAQDLQAEQTRDRAALSDAELGGIVDRVTRDGRPVDPAAIARLLNKPLDLVLRRLGVLRPGPWHEAGLIVCDGSGAPTFRHSAPGFMLPRPGEGCPLLPIFEALAQPQLPVSRLLETPEGERFAAWAIADRHMPMGFDGPSLSRAQMLFTPAAPDETRAPLPIGPACRICPRAGCPARNEPSILGPV